MYFLPHHSPVLLTACITRQEIHGSSPPLMESIYRYLCPHGFQGGLCSGKDRQEEKVKLTEENLHNVLAEL